MLLFRSELCKTYHKIFSFRWIKTDLLNKVRRVTWRKDCLYFMLCFFVPQLIHMTSCPRRVAGNLVYEQTTEFVKVIYRVVVNHFYMSHNWVLRRIFVVVLIHLVLNCGNHVTTDEWIMCIRIDLHPEENLKHGITKADTHGVNKDITGRHVDHFEAHLYIGKSLPNHCE